MMAERFLLGRDERDLRSYLTALEADVQTLIDVAYDLAWSGLRGDAFTLLRTCTELGGFDHPMIWYTLSWLASESGEHEASAAYLAMAEAAPSRYCFPARLEEMIVLEDAIRRNPNSAKANYYLGNLYYDKLRHEDAIQCWRRSVELDAAFSIPLRNLGIAEFNILHNPVAAERMYALAFAAEPNDARVLYEWDQLKKRAGLAAPEERLRWLTQHWKLVERRDDLTVEFVTLLNQCGKWQEALDHMKGRRFSPWEGGEGLVSAQYVHAHRALGRMALTMHKPAEALRHFEVARHSPHNLGEGKHLLTLERDLDYYSGLAAEGDGDIEAAHRYWRAAAEPLPAPGIHSYFQALSLRKLGNEVAAQDVFQTLAEFAAKQLATQPRIDYFATSLPNLLLFDDDLSKRNQVDSLLLSALASDGLGREAEALLQLEQVVAEDPNHMFAAEMLDSFRQRSKACQEGLPVNVAS
jgi:tetratricopeptide (TPR) repeat protein